MRSRARPEVALLPESSGARKTNFGNIISEVKSQSLKYFAYSSGRLLAFFLTLSHIPPFGIISSHPAIVKALHIPFWGTVCSSQVSLGDRSPKKYRPGKDRN
jgi:hypothetical protein